MFYNTNLMNKYMDVFLKNPHNSTERFRQSYSFNGAVILKSMKNTGIN